MDTHKTWMVTGASRGLGLSLVSRLLAQGHRVAATTRDLATLQSVAARHGSFLPLALDIRDPKAVLDAVSSTLERFGALDVLVNNAGFGLFGGIEETIDSEVREQYEVNVFGTLNVLRAALPHLRRQASGHIINVSSIAGVVSFGGWGVYCSTKFAVEGLSEALAQEVAPFGIQVTLLEPGYLRTGFLGGGSLRRAAQPIPAYVPIRELQRSLSTLHGQEIGDPAQVARVIISLAQMPHPPLRLVLGSDALQLARERLEKLDQGLRQHEALTLSTDFA